MSDTESFEALLDQFDRSHPGAAKGEPAVGDAVEGTLVSIGEEFAFVDLGAKSEGRLEVAALRDANGQLLHGVGDRISTRVAGKDEETGMLLLGEQQGHKYHGIEELERALRQGLPVQGQVTGAVKGGLEVQVAGMRGFCPASQADIRFIEDLSELVGQRLDFRITKLEGGRRPNVVLSRRAILEEHQRMQAEALRARLTEGAVLSGTVTSLKDYGAFVDLGGLEGMIHISELAFGHVRHPSDVLAVGQSLEVSVLRIEPPTGPRGREKIALSIRALGTDPWQDASSRFPVGMRLEGSVVRVQPFGVFVALADGLDGLIHISELNAGRRVNHPSEVVQVGDRVAVTVLGVDPERRRISLAREAEGVSAAPERQPAEAARGEAGASQEKAIGTFGALLKERLERGR